MVRYVEGDTTSPIGGGNRIIAHICNDTGRWGRGFVRAVSAKWPLPETSYKKWSRDWKKSPIALGSVQFVCVKWPPVESYRAPWLFVANIIGQHDIQPIDGIAPIRYEAVAVGLNAVGRFARSFEVSASVHMPRIGCGLAGGTWKKIEPIVQRELEGLDVVVYDFLDTQSPFYIKAHV